MDYLEPELKAIGFILSNEKSSQPLSQYAVIVNSVEKVTGIDFFYALPDNIEEKLESNVDLSLWSFSGYKASESSSVINKEDQSGAGKYWINTCSNTRHNSNCRYYGKTKEGYYTNQKIGKPCKICGG